MAKFSLSGVNTASLLNVLREVDVRAIRNAAEQPFTLAVVSRDLPMAKHLAGLLNTGPREYDVPSALAVLPVSLDEVSGSASAFGPVDVVLLLAKSSGDAQAEVELARQLEKQNKPLAVVLLGETPPDVDTLRKWHPIRPSYLPAPNVLNDEVFESRVVDAIIRLDGLDIVRAARHVPALRGAASKKLTADAANANAGYALGTGLMEIVPVVDVPLNVADMVVLTKNQGILAYKIALAHGMPSDFKTIMPQIAGVIGGGFIFRTIARTLVGLVPVIGIIPKVAVSYAGTVAIGEAIQRWCASGEQMSADALQKVFNAALTRGRALAGELQNRLPRRKASQRVINQLPKPE